MSKTIINLLVIFGGLSISSAIWGGLFDDDFTEKWHIFFRVLIGASITAFIATLAIGVCSL